LHGRELARTADGALPRRPGIAEALGVSRHAVHKWRSRYPRDSDHPFPEPDIEVDGAPGWAARRMDEILKRYR
jgi:hypothetical protein